ncbi:MAG: PA0069 family radical SAM protein [Alphaproteobacteria bacterium]
MSTAPDPLPYGTLERRPRKARGAVSNADGRFEPYVHELVDDGWGSVEPGDLDGRVATTVSVDASRTVIASNDSPDVPFDRSINPYRGCEHGCVYCFARPTHAFLGLSPGLDFETRLLAKPEAAKLLRAELARPSYRPAMIAMGTNTDPYQPVEKRLGITRAILEVLAEANHPVSITTKSALVTRDLDILGPMAAKGLASVAVSVTSLDPEIARTLEPRAARPAVRLEAIAACAAAGVPTAVMVAPVVPALTDHEMEAILAAARAAGATRAGWILLRLAMEVRGLFEEWLDAHAPDRKARVLSRLQAMRSGAVYQSDFGIRMTGSGPDAEFLGQRFAVACRRLGYDDGPLRHDTGRFRRPAADTRQLSLL